MEKRIITTDVTEEDYSLEGSLRPQTLEDYVGQEKTKSTLKIYIEAAKQRHDALDHVLFYGPPGLGKTTLSGIIANEMGVHMKVTSGPAIEKPGEMAAILNNLQLLRPVKLHFLNHPKPIPQRRCEKSRSGCSSYQGKMGQIQTDRTG